jgi:NADPH2:quinone reductase
MRAVLLDDYGSVDHFRLDDVPEPRPGPDDVLVRVAYAGIRWGDVMSRHGIPARFHTPPFVPGQEATGVVEEVGERVDRVQVGDRVLVSVLGGGYADLVTAPATSLVPVPAGVGLDQMLVYGINFPTAWLACTTWGQVNEGDTVLLHGAAGGVGQLALQILKRRLGARVAAVAGSDEKLDQCRTDGADLCINHRASDYVEAVREWCGHVDVVLNGVAGDTLLHDHRVIRPRGTWVIYGTAGGARDLPIWSFSYSSITVKPFSIIAFLATPEMAAARRAMNEWLASEPLITPLVRPLDEVADAQRELEAGRTRSKVVLAVDPALDGTAT